MSIKNYKTEKLSSDVSIYVSKEHTFGTDAVLLADFCAIKSKDVPLDMGTGCGIIPLIWCTKKMPSEIHCIDIQKNAVQQVNSSIEFNNLQNRLFVKNADLREIEKYYKRETFSLVSMNPPYKPLQTGIESTADSAKLARHEITCNINDAVGAAEYLLKFGGRLCMCHRPERLADVIDAFRKNKIEPKKIRFVVDKKGEEPFLFLIEGRKGGKPFLRVLPELSIKNENGKFSDEMMKIYGEYGEGYHQ